MNFDTKDIRNVALLGHSGAGKTTLAECMLFESGEINRIGTVEDGATSSDYTDLEKERKGSVFATLLHANWKDSKINIIDTPGSDDFVGEVVSSLRVAALGVMVLNAKSGVEVGTELVWEYIQRFETPSLFTINHIDHEKADFEQTLQQAIDRFGPKVIPIQFPYDHPSGALAIVDALRMVMYVFPDGGGKPEKESIPEEVMDRAKAMHNSLVEAAAEEDEGLMENYFEKGTLSEEELAKGLRMSIAQQDIFPVFCCSAGQNAGSGRIMGFINDICPSPADRPPVKLAGGNTLACQTNDDTTVFIFKTLSEPQVGNLSYFKVYSGVLRPGDELQNQATRQTERFGQLFLANGRNRTSIDQLNAGDIGVTVKLKNSHTNNTLNAKGIDRQIDPIHFPAPRIREAIKPPGKAEMEKLIKALHTIEEEDLTLQLEQSKTLKQTIIHGQGELHLGLVKHRVEKLSGIQMEFMAPKIPYRETITKKADTMYRHKKQTGGAGQFAEVHLRIEPWTVDMADPSDLSVRNKELEPLPWGGTLAFYWCIVGGSIDSKYANAIKKGILQKMEEGPLTGSNCQDIRVCIYDGKMHSVDSNDMAFMLAASAAFKSAFQEAAPQLLEPIYDVEILCSDEVMGDIMSDLQTRRALISGMDSDGHYQKIMAQVPLAEMYRYSSTLRSISQGRAKFNRTFTAYNPVPHDKQHQLIESYHAEMAEA